MTGDRMNGDFGGYLNDSMYDCLSWIVRSICDVNFLNIYVKSITETICKIRYLIKVN